MITPKYCVLEFRHVRFQIEYIGCANIDNIQVWLCQLMSQSESSKVSQSFGSCDCDCKWRHAPVPVWHFVYKHGGRLEREDFRIIYEIASLETRHVQLSFVGKGKIRRLRILVFIVWGYNFGESLGLRELSPMSISWPGAGVNWHSMTVICVRQYCETILFASWH